MAWTCDVDTDALVQLLDGCVAVAQDGWLTITNDCITARVLNTANTVYGRLTMPVTVVGDTDGAPIPVALSRVRQSLRNTQRVHVVHDGNIMTVTCGNTRVRFVDYSRAALREIPPQLDTDTPVFASDVVVKELHDAITAVTTYCDDDMAKVNVVSSCNCLTVCDTDRNVVTEIQCTTSDNLSIVLHARYLAPLTQYMKKYCDTCTLHARGSDTPLRLSTRSCTFMVAPVVQ